jgi:hypothetical protein
VDLDRGGTRFGGTRAASGFFGDGIGKEAASDAGEGGVVEVALDEVNAGGFGGREVVAERGGLAGEGCGARVDASGLIADFEAMDPPD